MRSLFFVFLFVAAPLFAEEMAANQYRVWLHPFGNWTQGNTRQDTFTPHEVTFSSYGLSLGFDRQFGRHSLLGVAIGDSETEVTAGLFEGKISGTHANVFFRRSWEPFYADAEFHVGSSEYTNIAPVKFKVGDWFQWGISAEAGLGKTHGLGRIEPYLRFSHFGTENSLTKDSVNLGLRYSWRTAGRLSTTVPRIYAGFMQELGSDALFQPALFGNSPILFPAGFMKMPNSRCFIGGGFTTTMGTSLDLLFRYTAEMAPDYTSHTALFGINCNF